MPRKRSSYQEIDERVEQLYELLLQGYSSTQVVQAAVKLWTISNRNAWRYLDKAKERLEAPDSEKSQQQLNSIKNRAQFVYNKSVKKDDLSTALKALKTELDTVLEMEKVEKSNVLPLPQDPCGSQALQEHLQRTRTNKADG